MDPLNRYETLDALRGVAALAVVMFHLGVVKLEPGVMPHGYLAVDFFFVLSGFVIAHAYGRALTGGLGFGAFFRKRLVRLYPLAAAGVLMGLAVLLLKWRLFPDRVDSLPQIAASGGLNLLMLPTPFGGPASHHELFPGNGAMWSLFFELLVNLAWAAWLVRLRSRWLIAILALGGAGVVYSDLAHETGCLGNTVETFPAGFARVFYGFTLGVLLHRHQDRLRARSLAWGAPLLVALLVIVVASPVSSIAWDVIGTLLVLPAIIAVGVSQRSPPRVAKLLGDMSYPIYVLHFPILAVTSGLRQSVLSQVNVHILSTAAVLAVLGASWVALKAYDEPVRRMLSRAAPAPSRLAA